MLILDSDACIDVLRGTDDGQRVVRLVGDETPAMSVITLHELVEGARRSHDPARSRRDIDRFVAAFDVLPLTPEVAWISGSVAGDLARAGAAIGDLDTLIAATALHHGGALVTRNERHFRRVPGLTVLAP